MIISTITSAADGKDTRATEGMHISKDASDNPGNISATIPATSRQHLGNNSGDSGKSGKTAQTPQNLTISDHTRLSAIGKPYKDKIATIPAIIPATSFAA